jgi:TPR repeat protein
MRSSMLLTLLVAASAYGAEPSDVQISSPEAKAAQAKYAAWEVEAERLSSAEIYKELKRLDTTRQSRLATADPPAAGSSPWAWIAAVSSEDDMRASVFSTMLVKRSQRGEVAASFYYGVYHWRTCIALEAVQAPRSKECWQETMTAFRRASEAQIGDASVNIARIYENGFGVTPSKLVAAEWYVKAANQHSMKNDREEALTAIESALNLVPDHPAGLRLRKQMLR